MPVECKVCLSSNIQAIEQTALRAAAGEIPWTEVVRTFPDEFTHAKGIQNHMERHYAAPRAEVDEAMDEYDSLLADAIRDLMDQMKMAPPDVKPLYAIAIKNLKGIADTNPSQQHLINALKGIHEVTGMKMEQRLMLDFARHHFGQVGAGAREAIEQHTGVIDVDEVE